MLPGRLLDWACFLAIVLSVHAAYVAPSRLAKELRAVGCCAKVCPRGPAIRSMRPCCGVVPGSADLATLSWPRHMPGMAARHVATLSGSGPAGERSPARWAPTLILERAGPIFLLTRSLRI